MAFVQIKTRGQDVYALFNKAFSTFALFKGKGSSISELVPYQISANYKPREDDKKMIKGLRKRSLGDKIEGSFVCHCFSLTIHHFIFY